MKTLLTNLIRFEQAVGKVLHSYAVVSVSSGYLRVFEWDNGLAQSVFYTQEAEDYTGFVQLVNHDEVKRLLFHADFIELYGVEAFGVWENRLKEEHKRSKYQIYLKLKQEFNE